MYEDITILHQEVFEFLQEKRKQNPDLHFALRTNNAANRLERGYWFWENNIRIPNTEISPLEKSRLPNADGSSLWESENVPKNKLRE